MVHNLTQGLLDIVGSLGGLGKTKVSTLANAIVDVMDEENELRKIVINQVMRDALVAMLFRENASADIIGATLVSSTVALLYIQELGNLNIDSALLNKIINIVFSRLSVNVEDIKALLTQVNIDTTLVKNIREVAIAPAAGQSFAAQLVIDGVDLSTLSNIEQRVFVANILKIYAQQKNLDLSKIGIVVGLNNGSSSGVRKAQVVSRGEVSLSGGATFMTVGGYDVDGGEEIQFQLSSSTELDNGMAMTVASAGGLDLSAMDGTWVALDTHQISVEGPLGVAAVLIIDEVEDADFSEVNDVNELSLSTVAAMSPQQWEGVQSAAFATMPEVILGGVSPGVAATWSPEQVAVMPGALQVVWAGIDGAGIDPADPAPAGVDGADPAPADPPAPAPDAPAPAEPDAGAEAASLSIEDYDYNAIAISTTELRARKEFKDDIKNLSIKDFENYMIENWVMNVNDKSYMLYSYEAYESDNDWIYFSTDKEFTPGEDKSGQYDVLFTKKAA